ncbi:hypothetical protein [Saccharopolyspora phatthalungensis]|uniref:Uncharacterized protein n=1 Tax=Saccharopolyspora phatthalungensis TaxID=664693 RepID=A0A840QAK1_9PSEU|nr:hypothetical protein [Saccharopolyspora phatthalungensis]MBB5156977.1 hypothetical protein [Saccharopolyspora phatthalungensis]
MSFIAVLALMACCVVGSAVMSGLAFAVNERSRRRIQRRAAQQTGETDTDTGDWREAAGRAVFRG